MSLLTSNVILICKLLDLNKRRFNIKVIYLIPFLKCSGVGWSICKSSAHVRIGYALKKKVKRCKPPFFV